MSETKFTPGPWRWQGEDYRGGWGWQILVGPKGEGIVVGQDVGGNCSPHLKAHMPVSPDLCVTGWHAKGVPHVESVHVFQPDAALIAAAPDLYAALKQAKEIIVQLANARWSELEAADEDLTREIDAALARARGEEPAQ